MFIVIFYYNFGQQFFLGGAGANPPNPPLVTPQSVTRLTKQGKQTIVYFGGRQGPSAQLATTDVVLSSYI